ncbi:MAG: hypothetical protein ABJA49_05050 [Betaproteobacteria bacterium]
MTVASRRGPRQAKTPAGAFIAGAKGRLLPASIPLRYFGAAVVYHLLAWLALAAGATTGATFGAGLGWPLAALHLVTLGVLGMTVLGAGAQLLPVASRQAATGPHLLAAIWWLYTPGVAVLTLGMGLARPPLIAAGALVCALALLFWAQLTGRNLFGSHGMPGVVGHGWSALAALALVLLAALALVAIWLGWPAPARDTALMLHRVMAPYGFIGLFTLGLSYVLVPMFVLADSPPERHQLASLALLVLALVLAGLATWGLGPPVLLVWGLLAGTAAVTLHLWLMARVMRQGMRRFAGPSGMLVRLGWGGLAASLVLGWVLLLQWPLPHAGLWFGLCLIGVWQMSFLLGMLQRIAPFLAAMHAPVGRRAPTPSALTHDGALRLHLICHICALVLLAGAFATGNHEVLFAAACLGAVGALAFATFFAVLLWRLRRPATTTPRSSHAGSQ